METTKLYTLGVAARLLRVPAPWLRQQAAEGRIPHLAAGKRLMFNVPAVARILERWATKPYRTPRNRDRKAVRHD